MQAQQNKIENCKDDGQLQELEKAKMKVSNKIIIRIIVYLFVILFCMQTFQIIHILCNTSSLVTRS